MSLHEDEDPPDLPEEIRRARDRRRAEMRLHDEDLAVTYPLVRALRILVPLLILLLAADLLTVSGTAVRGAMQQQGSAEDPGALRRALHGSEILCGVAVGVLILAWVAHAGRISRKRAWLLGDAPEEEPSRPPGWRGTQVPADLGVGPLAAATDAPLPSAPQQSYLSARAARLRQRNLEEKQIHDEEAAAVSRLVPLENALMLLLYFALAFGGMAFIMLTFTQGGLPVLETAVSLCMAAGALCGLGLGAGAVVRGYLSYRSHRALREVHERFTREASAAVEDPSG